MSSRSRSAEQTRDRRRSAVVLLLLGLLALAVLWPALGGGRALVGLHTSTLSPWRSPAGLDPPPATPPILADKTIQFWPLLATSLERLAAGEVPLWNPHNLGGVPLLAQGFQGTFHPPNLLALLLPWPAAFGWIAWVQAVVAGWAAYALLRELACRRVSAFLAASTWMLCAYATARWHWYMIQGCTAYLPLALLGVERLCAPLRARASDAAPGHASPWRGAVALALAVGLAWLTGWMQGALHLVYAAAIWAAVAIAPALLRSGPERRTALACGARCAAALALGLMLGSPQLLPTAEWVASGESARDSEPPEVVQSLGMSPWGLLGLLTPDNLGHPVELLEHPLPALRGDGVLRRLIHQRNGNFVETSGFVGVSVLLLAAVGAASTRRGRGVGLLLLGAGLVLCLETPLLLLVARLPGLSSSDPLRFLLLFSVGAMLLGALGLDRVARGATPRWAGLTGLALAAAAGLGAVTLRLTTDDGFAAALAPALARKLGLAEAEIRAHAADLGFDRRLLTGALLHLAAVAAASGAALLLARRRPALGALCLLAVALGEQGWAARRNAVTVAREDLFAPPPMVAELARGGRLLPIHRGGSGDPLGGPFPGNTALPFRIDALAGYWALAPRRIVEVFEALAPGSTYGLGSTGLADARLLASPLFELLGVQQALGSEPISAPGFVDAGRVGPAWWVRREAPTPMAWFSSGQAVADDAAALSELLAAGPERWRATPLSPVGGRSPPVQQPLPLGEPPVVVEVARESAESCRITLDAPRSGIVVLAQAYSPGWSATRDGEPVPLWPAWHALTALEVGPGRQELALRYDSPGLRAGLVLAPLALLTLLGLLVAPVVLRRGATGAVPRPAAPLRTG